MYPLSRRRFSYCAMSIKRPCPNLFVLISMLYSPNLHQRATKMKMTLDKPHREFYGRDRARPLKLSRPALLIAHSQASRCTSCCPSPTRKFTHGDRGQYAYHVVVGYSEFVYLLASSGVGDWFESVEVVKAMRREQWIGLLMGN